MVQVKRFLVVAGLLALSMVLIHTIRAPQKAEKSYFVACFPLERAQQIDTNNALKWNAKISYDTVEDDGSSYRCYIAFPEADAVVCTPKRAAARQDIDTKTCPSFPSLQGKSRTCYFINPKHHELATQLKSGKPRLRMRDLNGVIVKTVDEAKNVLSRAKN